MGSGRSPVGGGAKIDFASREEAENYFKMEWYNGLNWREQMALYAYTEVDYREINGFLRHGTYISDENKGFIDLMDTAIAKSVLKDNIVVHRGSTGEMFGFPANYRPTVADLKQFVGRSFTDKGFVSTSAGQGGFLDSVMFDITVPKGKGRGGYLGWESAHPTEAEFVLKRGASYKITDVTMLNGVPLVHLTMS